MKNLIILLVGLMFFVSCSPKYTASFQNYDRYNSLSDNKSNVSESITKTQEEININLASNIDASSNGIPIAYASTEKNVLPRENSSIESSVVVSNEAKSTIQKKPSKGEIKEAKKILKSEIKKFKVDSITAKKADGAGGKSQVTALLLVIFLGLIGVHRFYLGYTWQGVVQLLTLGLFGIWTLIDLVRIITGDLQPKSGKYTKEL